VTHAPLHVVSLWKVHPSVQKVWLHTWVDEHALPQAPQLSWSDESCVHEPPQNVSDTGH
jgi:hypothetical protein